MKNIEKYEYGYFEFKRRSTEKLKDSYPSAWMTAWPSLVQMDYLGPLLIFQSINRGKYLDSGENIQFVLKNLGPFGPRNGGWSSKH